jgi:hypothetical protein
MSLDQATSRIRKEIGKSHDQLLLAEDVNMPYEAKKVLVKCVLKRIQHETSALQATLEELLDINHSELDTE